MSRFSYVRYDQESIDKSEKIKKMCEDMEAEITTLGIGRYQALAMTKLEECFMHVGKAIRDKQIARYSQPEHRPERGE